MFCADSDGLAGDLARVAEEEVKAAPDLKADLLNQEESNVGKLAGKYGMTLAQLKELLADPALLSAVREANLAYLEYQAYAALKDLAEEMDAAPSARLRLRAHRQFRLLAADVMRMYGKRADEVVAAPRDGLDAIAHKLLERNLNSAKE